MSKRLSRAQRESIIIDFINHKETPGYQVIENTNGKFIVRALKEEPKVVKQPPKPSFEMEEEVNEEVNEQQEEDEEAPQATKKNVIDHIGSKQDARELLRQLSQLLDEGEPNQQQEQWQGQQGQYIEKRYRPGPQSWARKKLVF